MRDIMERPSRRTAPFIVKNILVPLLLIIACCSVFLGYTEGQRYLQLREHSVQVAVEESRIEEDEDSEGDTDYDLYVQYTYNGQRYEILYQRYNARKSAVSAQKSLTTLRIDPNDPVCHVEGVREDSMETWFFGALALALSAACCAIPGRKAYVQEYGWLRQYVEKDLVIRLRRRMITWVPELLFSVVCFAGWIPCRMWMLFISGGISLVVGVIFAIRWLRNRTLIYGGEYSLRQDVLEEKAVKSDSEGKNYHIYYSNGKEKWCRNTPKRVYDLLNCGDTVETVYLGEQKRPFFAFCRYSGDII